MGYSPPADQIVFDEAVTGASPILGTDSEFSAVTISTWMGRTYVVAARVPHCANEFLKCVRTSWNAPIIFLHERTTPSGHRYLVALTKGDVPLQRIGQLPVIIKGLTPGTVNAPPLNGSGWLFYDGPILDDRQVQLRIYAGQADPNDEFHFTVRYEQEGLSKSVDGYISDVLSGTLDVRVKLIERSPTTRPASR